MTNNNNMASKASRCGYIAIVGRPNVGKSTLLNHILGMKLSITSRKPQTTRHQLLGVKTVKQIQMIYVDTPGIHQRSGAAINKYMNKAATSVLNDVDIVLFVVQATQWVDEDQAVIELFQHVTAPVILVVNKIDRFKQKHDLLPVIEKIKTKYPFNAVIPVSALNNINLDELEKKVSSLLPEAEHFFSSDQITDRSERFLATEIIREKIVRELGQELPYASTVLIDRYEDRTDIVHIHATIFVETDGQKSIIIGRKGERLKSIGTRARQEISSMINNKVYLNLWVKVRAGWSNDERALRGLGYSEQ